MTNEGPKRWPRSGWLYFAGWAVWVVGLFAVGAWYLAVPFAVVVIFLYWWSGGRDYPFGRGQ